MGQQYEITDVNSVNEIESEPFIPPPSENMQAMSKSVDITKETSAQEGKLCYTHLVPENNHYSFNLKNGHNIELELDNQPILIRDENARVMTLVETDIRELSGKPEHPNYLFLFLQRNNCLNHIDFSYFDNMPDLRFLDLSDTKIKILPTSLFSLSKLEVLMLRNCICLGTLPSEIGKLNQLKVLDLLGTELYSLPDEIDQLTLLSHLLLSFYGPDDESEYAHLPSKLISENILSKLKALEALSIIVHPEDHRWTKTAACITKDVGSLGMLRFLQFYFPEEEMFEDFIQMSPSWKENKLREFKFIVGHNVKRVMSRVPDEVESMYNQQNCCLRFVNASKVPQVIQNVLAHATTFYLDHHLRIKSLSEFDMISMSKTLKFCVVTECPKIQEIIDEKSCKNGFSCLEHLGVYYLWELMTIWNIPAIVPSGNFHALKSLIVNTCPKLRFVICGSMIKSLSNLEEIVVEDCESVEKIVGEEKDILDSDDIMLPKLQKLVLRYLPELVSLGNGLCPTKEKIMAYGCPKLNLNSLPKKDKRVKKREFIGSVLKHLKFRPSCTKHVLVL